MKLCTPAVLVAAMATAAAPALANLDLAQKNACTVCHAVDKMLLGPSYHDVAKKYAGQGGPRSLPPTPLAAWVVGGAK